jgi:cysteine desulfuration protein SufE
MDAAPPTPTIDAELAELADEFEVLGDWEERYRYVIDLGRDLAPLSDAERSDANKVRGCASQVWLVTEPPNGVGPDGTIRFRGDSDAHIVRGLIAIVLRLFSGRRPAEVLAFDAPAAFETLGLKGALSQQRSNGLASMVARIRADAEAAQ